MNKELRPVTAIIIQEHRLRNYKTAKEFWTKHQATLKVSYPHYSNIETGMKLPDIELAITIAKLLKIEVRHICHAWAKDNMPGPETKAFFEPIPGREEQGVPSSVKTHLDDYFIFTEKHLPFLTAHAKAWEVMSFILAFAEGPCPTEKQITKVLGIDAKTLSPIIEWLRNEGLVISEGGKLLTKVKFFHLPNTEPFRKLRNTNFATASQEVLQKLTAKKIRSKEAYRTVFSRRLTSTQATEISEHIDNLVGHLGNIPDKGENYYSLAIAFGDRATFTGRE